MARTYDEIDDTMREWIARQPMFFVGSAPLAEDGHVNLSPKGPGGSLRVLGPTRVAYLDIVGSGAETIAHLRENGRIVVMFCAFEGPPRIVRLHGRGEVVLLDDPRYDRLLADAAFAEATVPEARRAIVLVDVARIGSSCGYGVPLMDYAGERPHTDASTRKRLRTGGPDAIVGYQQRHNLESIDGLPAVPALDRSSV
ncbi:MAG: pyridoxamine 5'-phosphate oxidase family protein [Solirubrobacteraceae bacterium]